ncbi:MAG: tRNA pseudouridine(38-40) synthase TruA [Xanthomonadales bacterium]|jgi:tRNA pseudouridine38-40 synthase|nr:tRNA pseudouridine(38-40) synthase TruA [Xanthomonadales bacterium]
MRYALGVEYDGRPFYGWQTQRQEPTVQAELERALGRVADHPVSVVCAGRTDTGVHARCQVVHFDSNADRSVRSWILGTNSNLPAGVCVLWLQPVSEDFHARFSAYARSYRYVILNRWIRPAIDQGLVSWQRRPLDQDAMNDAAQALLGEHDFSAFRSAGCSANHPVRDIQAIAVHRQGEHVTIDITANGFLYHMVRNIAGTLMDVGTGEQPVSWVKELLEGRDRTRAGVTAPPDGLYFVGVRYPEVFGLPTTPPAFGGLESP